MWGSKLGLGQSAPGDDELVAELVSLLKVVETDMTIFFRSLGTIDGPNPLGMAHAYCNEAALPIDELGLWLGKWWSRVDGDPDRGAMNNANPKYVLRTGCRNSPSRPLRPTTTHGDRVAGPFEGRLRGTTILRGSLVQEEA